jgi:RimJ/RimL family protein N-acetyltransferase
MTHSSSLKIVTPADVPTVVQLLCDMQDEVQELELDPEIVASSLKNALMDQVTWFLFLDEHHKPFGTCYLESIHNYWSIKKRFYVGGFYIAPTHRGQGRFRTINTLLDAWIDDHNGYQIFAHIHKDNHKSLGAFGAVSLSDNDYVVCSRSVPS